MASPRRRRRVLRVDGKRPTAAVTMLRALTVAAAVARIVKGWVRGVASQTVMVTQTMSQLARARDETSARFPITCKTIVPLRAVTILRWMWHARHLGLLVCVEACRVRQRHFGSAVTLEIRRTVMSTAVMIIIRMVIMIIITIIIMMVIMIMIMIIIITATITIVMIIARITTTIKIITITIMITTISVTVTPITLTTIIMVVIAVLIISTTPLRELHTTTKR